jgi:hypothetical protein
MNQGQQFPEQYGYHCSDSTNRESIRKHGLITNSPGADMGLDEESEHPNGVYYTEPGQHFYDVGTDVWKLKLPHEKHLDYTRAGDSISKIDIPPHHVELVGHTGRDKSLHLGNIEDCKDCD